MINRLKDQRDDMSKVYFDGIQLDKVVTIPITLDSYYEQIDRMIDQARCAVGFSEFRDQASVCAFIEDALDFAQSHLGIRYRDFRYAYEVLQENPFTYWAGVFKNAMMYYNGEPTLDTIFHEAVHYAQWERGELVEGLAHKSYNDYWNHPTEVEARQKATELESKYLTRCHKPMGPYVRPADMEVTKDFSCYYTETIQYLTQ